MSPRAVGWAIAAGLACVPLLLMMLGPWLLTGRMIVEFGDVDQLYRPVTGKSDREVAHDPLPSLGVGCREDR